MAVPQGEQENKGLHVDEGPLVGHASQFCQRLSLHSDPLALLHQAAAWTRLGTLVERGEKEMDGLCRNSRHGPSYSDRLEGAENAAGFFEGLSRGASPWVDTLKAPRRSFQRRGVAGGNERRGSHLANEESDPSYRIIGQHGNRHTIVFDLSVDLPQGFDGEPDHQEASPSLVNDPNTEDARQGR